MVLVDIHCLLMATHKRVQIIQVQLVIHIQLDFVVEDRVIILMFKVTLVILD